MHHILHLSDATHWLQALAQPVLNGAITWLRSCCIAYTSISHAEHQGNGYGCRGWSAHWPPPLTSDSLWGMALGWFWPCLNREVATSSGWAPSHS
jgi:hypothetical protein